MTEFFTPLHLIFYLFAFIAIGSAFAVVTVKNPVHSVLSLVITFFAMAGIWMLLSAEFLSLILLLVYVGAVMTLFLFVVMMLNIDTEPGRESFVKYWPLGLIIILLLTAMLITFVSPEYFGLTRVPAPLPEPADYSNLQALGNVLYTQYAYPFEIAGVILLAAMIAAITLAYRGPHRRKVQKAAEQIAVRPEDRVRLIKMPAEPKQKGV
jgi:NADH-quinone oxidoreductase subunit J